MLRYKIASRPKDVKKHLKVKKKNRKLRQADEKDKQLLIRKREMTLYFPLPMNSQKGKKKTVCFILSWTHLTRKVSHPFSTSDLR